MSRDRLNILYVSMFPPSPPTFGAQRRLQGLMAALSRRHEITAITLVPRDMDGSEAERAMREYCRDVVLVPARAEGSRKRIHQLQSLLSRQSFERSSVSLPTLKHSLERI